MNYFNQTEEVLEIKLTPYGKALYSVGKFNPKYYSFSDEGVVYNVSGITGSSGYLSEEQNETNGRIINDTPYLKISNRNIHTSEDNIRSQTTSPISTSPNDPNVSTIFNQVILGQDPDMVEKLIIDKNFDLYCVSDRAKLNSLGNIVADTNAAPKFSLYLLNGGDTDIKNVQKRLIPLAEYTTGSTGHLGHPDIDIPQIDIDYVLKSSIVNSNNPERLFSTTTRATEDNILINADSIMADDGQVVYQLQELYFWLQEDNTNNFFENFEIEVYEVMEDVDQYISNNHMRRLAYTKSSEDYETKNNLLLTSEEVKQLEQLDFNLNSPRNVDLVSYYLDIFSDSYEEISTDVLCRYISEIKAKGFAMDAPIECPDMAQVNQVRYDIYASDKDPTEAC